MLVHVLLVGAACAVSALAWERAARAAGMPIRVGWVVALLASTILPWLGLAGVLPDARGPLPLPALLFDPVLVTPDGAAGGPHESLLSAPSLTRFLAATWVATSAFLLVRLLVGIVAMRAMRRRWVARRVNGVPVLISRDVGPAIVAWPRPAIVLPAWVVAMPAGERELVLRHEQEHLRAGDAWLLLGAALVTALVPWNPAPWFIARRLAIAIEVDCDARLLRAHPHRQDYAELLLAMAQRAAGPSLIPALFEGITQLERRIDIMHTPAPTHPRARAVLLSLAAIVALATAFTIPAPRSALAARVARIATAPRVDTVFFEYQVDSVAAIVSAAPARYPDALRAAKTEGEVLVQFVVGLDSLAEMGSFKVLKSDHGAFTDAVREALPRYRFAPARRGGKPVKQLVQMPFVFSLSR
jgi:TonB family protein